MSVLTAYVAAMFRWCDVTDGVIQYVTDGRSEPNLREIIGFFACPLSLRIELSRKDTLADLMHRVVEEYCRACEHADAAHISAQSPRPEFARNSTFNWIPHGSSSWVAQGSRFESVINDGPRDLRCTPIAFEHPIFRTIDADREPFILLFETDDEITGGVQYPRNRFASATMERFAQQVMLFLRALLREPDARVVDIALPP
jgi:non-ribosomal peptide synthetase component F